MAINFLKEIIVSDLTFLFYVKNLKEPQKVTNNNMEIFSFIQSKNSMESPKIFEIILTHKDVFFELSYLEEEIKDSTAIDPISFAMKQKCIMYDATMAEIKTECKQMNISLQQIYFINSFVIRNPKQNPQLFQKEKKIFEKFIKELKATRLIYLKQIKPIYYLENLVKSISEWHEKFSANKISLSQSNIEEIEYLMQCATDDIKDKLTVFLAKIDNLNELKKSEVELYEEISKIIKKIIDEEKKKEFKLNRDNFIKLVLNLSSSY